MNHEALAIDLLEWQKRFGTEEECGEALARQSWLEGFRCPRCGHDHGYSISTRQSYECSSCHYQASLTADTLFHSTNLPLTKWFWAIYVMASDKDGISTLRLAKQIGVSWVTAHRMLRKIRIAMGHRDSVYRLHNLGEIDDALVGGRGPGKRDRSAKGKVPVLIAVEDQDTGAGFMAMHQVPAVTKETVAGCVKCYLPSNLWVRSDKLAALGAIGETRHHAVTPHAKSGEWLPWVHVAIGNLKAFLLGTYQGVSSKHLQEYLNEFCYRFNRRSWEREVPMHQLNACLTQTQVKTENDLEA